MKNMNILVAGLITIIAILLYQFFDLKQEIRNLHNSNNNINRVVTMNGNLGLYDQNTLSGGPSSDGYWLYKESEQQIYFFRYDSNNNSIVQIKKNITQE